MKQNDNHFDLTKVETFKDMGRGIVSRVNLESSYVGNTVMVCEVLVLSKNDTVVVNLTDLKHYTFKFDDEQDCLVLGHGEIFNHSAEPNVSYRLEDFEDAEGNQRRVMVFRLLKPVTKGEQLFIDYNADVAVDVEAYKTSKSLVG